MRRIGGLVILGTVLVGLSLLWNTFAADAPPGPDDASMLRLMEHRLNWTSGLISLAPTPINTPAPPAVRTSSLLQRVPSELSGTAPGPQSASQGTVQEISAEVGLASTQSLKRDAALGQQSVRFALPERRMPTAGAVAPLTTSEERCVNVLRNPQLDVVEFGDGTGSIEYWSILFQKVYYDPQHYDSPSYSLVMVDELDGSDPVSDPWGLGMDYDAFGQGFWTPPNLTLIRAYFSSDYVNYNTADHAWSNLWTLTAEGYLDELVVEVPVPQGSADDFDEWYWEVKASEHPQLLAAMSNRPLAIVYDHLSDRQAPGQVIWLDDLYVILCYEWEPPTSAVYLPLVRRDPPADPGPRCLPREPDSLENRGFTTVDATCGSSFTPLDQRDYYTLDLRGAANVRLRLFDLPSGTNWDAMIYENVAGYPLACHIGTPGHAPKSVNCTLNPNKDYFVLVNRGPQPTGGLYRMRVERR